MDINIDITTAVREELDQKLEFYSGEKTTDAFWEYLPNLQPLMEKIGEELKEGYNLFDGNLALFYILQEASHWHYGTCDPKEAEEMTAHWKHLEENYTNFWIACDEIINDNMLEAIEEIPVQYN